MVPSLVSDYALKRLEGCRMGSVHSSFATSLNIDMDGFLLHVGSDDAPLSCLGLSIAADEMEGLRTSVEPGDRVVLHDGVIRIYGRFGIGEIDICAASTRACSVPAFDSDKLVGIDSLLLHALGPFDLPVRCGLPGESRSRRVLSELARYSAICSIVAAGDAQAASTTRAGAARRAMTGAVDYLVGRGLGLTPSGDDVLCGFGTGLRFLYSEAYPKAWNLYTRAVRDMVPSKTTRVSEAYLEAMCRRYANADYLNLLDAIRSGRLDDLPALIETVLNVGHTSGADSLLGFAAAFCCLF